MGNQMFQYATARALESRKSENVILDFFFLNSNTLSSETFTAREFELGIFTKLRAEALTDFRRKLMSSQSFFYRKMRRLIGFKVVYVQQKENEFVAIPYSKDIYLDGYFQSEKYFKHIREELLSDFAFPLLDESNQKLKDKMLKENSVSIHVRRGDYVSVKKSLDYHGVLSLQYYKKALEVLNSKSGEEKTYYIFSDDPQFIKDNFGFLPQYEFVEGNRGKDSWKDMALMQACKHHIVANSSFSWWGAWLSDRRGVTIAPSDWLNSHVSFDIHDFIPNEWEIV